MDPGIDSEWLTCKNDLVDESPPVGNVSRSWQWRELGINPPRHPSNKTVLENAAEDILVQKSLDIRSCDLPGYPRSTFLMVFSPDGTKVASTHGNHNVYVSELASGKHVRILRGHPRTPWCVAFHPSHPQLIGSGCLGGQVRVWDITSGGSEVWSVQNETVIASIAFHPRDQLLVIATHNELYFWDWSRPVPFTRVSTSNINEKVRYVAFDALGFKLITGISLSANMSGANSVLQQNPMMGPTNNQNNNRRDDNNGNSSNRGQDNSGSAQDMIVNSYQNLVQRYDSLVRNYQRLFMVRHRLTNTPPPPSTIDRGTDPMESDITINPPAGPSDWSQPSSSQQDDATGEASPEVTQGSPEPERARASPDARPQESPDSEASSSRLLNLDVLSFGTNPTRNQEQSNNSEYSIFGSRSSAFQPLTEGRSFRTVYQSEISSRLLPNPFSSSRPARTSRGHFSDGNHRPTETGPNTARTSIFTSSRSDLSFLTQGQNLHRNLSPSGRMTRHATPSIFSDEPIPLISRATLNAEPDPSPPRPNTPSTSGASTSQRPSMTNSSTQMSPVAATNIDAQTINESLDLIRDILRDSGTRLLNLITNMSLSALANVEWNVPRREQLLSSSSDSDSDQSLEVNIFRTRNSTFQDNEYRPIPSTSSGRTHPIDRMEIELNDDARNEDRPSDSTGVNVLLSSNRFRVRTQSNATTEEAGPSHREPRAATENRLPSAPSDFNPNRPSTSREGTGLGSRNVTLPPDEAYRKVRLGVNLLQKHTMHLTDLWLRGSRVTMRELRLLWENLRRRILVLHRETGRQDTQNQFYTRSLLDRCMMLTEMGDVSRTTVRNTRNNRPEENERNSEENNDVPGACGCVNPAAGESSATSENVNETRSVPSGRHPPPRSAAGMRASPSLRRRLQSSYRWRPDDEMRRRSRNPISSRLASRYTQRSRRDIARALEISTTRHEIRMRAMQVLSTMFNIMMMCLEERGLSQLIINMLRSLKKALAFTCLMLMTNRNNNRAGNSPAATASRVESLNVIRIQNADHSEPVNVDGSDEPASPSNLSPRPTTRNMAEENSTTTTTTKADENANPSTEQNEPPTYQTSPVDLSRPKQEDTSSPSTSNAIQRWSNRLAVQIAAANRNNSATARNRRELYIESKRLQALHRTNPAAHPFIKKRAPPVSTHRIPALRSLPSRLRSPRVTPRGGGESPSNLAVPGPSRPGSPPPGPSELPREEILNEFQQRLNLIRIAHLQAVRMRNAARTRFRRLQTIRLYTPSSVREMFDLQSNNSDNAAGSRSPLQAGSEFANRRSFAAYRPHILTPRSDAAGRPADDSGHFHTVLNNVAMPLLQVNDSPTTSEANQNGQPQRMPRIHEYLQPILLAQNAMVVDEENGAEAGGGGPGLAGPRRFNASMPGLLDAGIISETLPAPSHRVQAWDFTAGEPPHISDGTRNVVVQRCRIHNDASIDISKDGRILVALLPVPRLRNTNHWLGKIGVYSLEWSRLGACVHTCVLEQSAVSVALSPTARHLAVGLGSRRFASAPHPRTNVFALLYRLEPLESSSRTGLSPIKELEQHWEQGFTSLNCLRWAPQPGQGLVYANNTGQLIIMS